MNVAVRRRKNRLLCEDIVFLALSFIDAIVSRSGQSSKWCP
jgi:hypothetical protein